MYIELTLYVSTDDFFLRFSLKSLKILTVSFPIFNDLMLYLSGSYAYRLICINLDMILNWLRYHGYE